MPRREAMRRNPRPQRGRSVKEDHKPDSIHHTLNTIVEGLLGGGESKSSKKNYAKQVMHTINAPPLEKEILAP